MHQFIRRGAQVAAGAWFLSWFALYFEIVRWHHVVSSRLVSVVWPTAGTADQPGAFVKTVVICSAVAPFVCLTFAAAQWKHRLPSERGALGSTEPKFVGAEGLAVFGTALSVLGAINQAVRHPPLVVDLTLQRGNGGFIVLGMALVAGGFLLQRRKRHDASASLNTQSR